MEKHTIVNVHRVTQQHGSIVVVIPIIVRTILKLDPGDYIVFIVGRDFNKVEISKFEMEGADDVADH